MAAQTIPGDRWWGEHRFYTGMTLAIFVTVFVGFARSFFLRPLFPTWPSPPEKIFYVHGAFFTAWFVLLLTQASLVAAGRTDVHRKLGRWGVALAVGMVVLGVLGALTAARRPTGFVGIPVPPLQFLVVPLFDMLMFTSLVSLAIAKRGNPQAHKRWMLLASLNLITAAIARWPGVITVGAPPLFFGLTDLFLLPIVIWDLKSRGRVHPATVWGGLLIIVSQPLRLVVSGTPAWLAFARWATGLQG